MKKYFIGLIFVLSLGGNLWANDIAEDNAVKISRIVTKALVQTGMDTVAAETYERLTYKIIGALSKEVVFRFCSGEQFVKSHEFIAALIENGTFEKKVFRKFNDGLKSDLVWLASDIFVELIKNSIEEYSTLQYRYMKSTIWWIEIGYTDLKAAFNPNKIIGTIDFVVGNGAVLADMGIEIRKTLVEIGETQWDIMYKNAMLNIMILEDDYLKRYTKATTKQKKDEILEEFKEQCLVYKVYGDIFSTGHRDVFNSRINGLIIDAESHIVTFDNDKFIPLYLMISKQDQDRYNKYVSTFFPEEQIIFLINYYRSENNFLKPKVLTETSKVAYRFGAYALEYGFELEDFNILYISRVYGEIEKHIAYNLISKLKYKLRGVSEGAFPSGLEKITRDDFAKRLNEQISLESDYLDKPDKQRISMDEKLQLVINHGWTHNALVLNKLKIVQGDPKKIDFRPTDYVTTFEAMIMIVRTYEYCERNK